MRLVEIIPGEETDAGLCEAFAAFADRNLGKQVVFARDTPNFIANRIGAFSMLTGLSITALRHYDEVGLLHPATVDVSGVIRSPAHWPSAAIAGPRHR